MKTDLTCAGYIFHKDKLLLIHHAKLNLWLPVGGHIDENEIPDDAIIREAREETGLIIKVLDPFPTKVPMVKGIKKQTATPFYTNVHSVGDHDHYRACYIAVADSNNVKINNESKDYKWVSLEELTQLKDVREDIKVIAQTAFSHYRRIIDLQKQ